VSNKLNAYHRCLVTFLGPSGTSVGMGFLVGERLILTCAHVVESAIGRKKPQEQMPGDPVSIEFPFLHQEGKATVSQWRHCKVSPSLEREGAAATTDLALLTLVGDPPPDAYPITLVKNRSGEGLSCKCYGTPDPKVSEDWVYGQVGEVHPGGYRDFRPPGGDNSVLGNTFFVSEGFSGSPVYFQDDPHLAWGMVTMIKKRGGSRIAYLVPAHTLIEVFPGVKREDYAPPKTGGSHVSLPDQVIARLWRLDRQPQWYALEKAVKEIRDGTLVTVLSGNQADRSDILVKRFNSDLWHVMGGLPKGGHSARIVHKNWPFLLDREEICPADKPTLLYVQIDAGAWSQKDGEQFRDFLQEIKNNPPHAGTAIFIYFQYSEGLLSNFFSPSKNNRLGNHVESFLGAHPGSIHFLSLPPFSLITDLDIYGWILSEAERVLEWSQAEKLRKEIFCRKRWKPITMDKVVNQLEELIPALPNMTS